MDINRRDIQDEVYKLGHKISAPIRLLSVLDQPADDGTPYVEITQGSLCYVSSERGYELYRKVAQSLEDLLYFVFDRVTSRMAVEYELDNRVAGVDSRRIYFSKKIELMSELDPQWGRRAKQEVERILNAAPYIDI